MSANHHIEIGSQFGCDQNMIEDCFRLSQVVLHGAARRLIGRMRAFVGQTQNRVWLKMKAHNRESFLAVLKAKMEGQGYKLGNIDWRVDNDGAWIARVPYPEYDATHAEIIHWAQWMLALLVNSRDALRENYQQAA